jgi:hypothetical protein
VKKKKFLIIRTANLDVDFVFHWRSKRARAQAHPITCHHLQVLLAHSPEHQPW